MHAPEPLGGKIFTKPFKTMMVIAIVAFVLLAVRFLFGIGAVTNLSHGYPWGLWIVYDVVTATAISCGGYSIALIVYIFNKGEYHPLVRSALLASMFGYTLAGFAIFVDIGRYWQMYNIFLPGYANVNSVMFEVAFSISIYIFVMWIEFSPTFLEAAKKHTALKNIKKVMFVFIALGVLFPTMHQSALGTLMVVAGDKLSALWQTGWLPLLFLITAISMGFAIVVFESIFSSITFKRPFETPLLSKLAGVMPKLLILFFIVRFGDIFWRGAFGEALRFDLNAIMFWVENLIFLYAIITLMPAEKRNQTKYLYRGAVALIIAGALYRFDVFIVAFNPGAGWHYFPSASEIIITVGMICIELMAYLVIVKKFSVLPKVEHA